MISASILTEWLIDILFRLKTSVQLTIAIYLIQIEQKKNATGFEKINLPLKQKLLNIDKNVI